MHPRFVYKIGAFGVLPLSVTLSNVVCYLMTQSNALTKGLAYCDAAKSLIHKDFQ